MPKTLDLVVFCRHNDDNNRQDQFLYPATHVQEEESTSYTIVVDNQVGHECVL